MADDDQRDSINVVPGELDTTHAAVVRLVQSEEFPIAQPALRFNSFKLQRFIARNDKSVPVVHWDRKNEIAYVALWALGHLDPAEVAVASNVRMYDADGTFSETAPTALKFDDGHEIRVIPMTRVQVNPPPILSGVHPDPARREQHSEATLIVKLQLTAVDDTKKMFRVVYERLHSQFFYPLTGLMREIRTSQTIDLPLEVSIAVGDWFDMENENDKVLPPYISS